MDSTRVDQPPPSQSDQERASAALAGWYGNYPTLAAAVADQIKEARIEGFRNGLAYAVAREAVGRPIVAKVVDGHADIPAPSDAVVEQVCGILASNPPIPLYGEDQAGG